MIRALFGLILVAFATSSTNAAVLYSSSGGGALRDGYTANAAYAGTLGVRFSVSSTISVTDLGYFDGPNSVSGSVGDGLLNSHDVGIWNAGGTLLGSVTVTAASSLNGDFRYQPLGSALVLTPGTYTLGGQVTTLDLTASGDVFRDRDNAISGDAAAAGIAFVSGAYTDPDDGNPGFNNGIFARPTEYTSQGHFGPNMVFTPEPSALSLLGLGTLGLFRIARRRRKA